MNTPISGPSAGALAYEKWQKKQKLSIDNIRALFRDHFTLLVVHRDLPDAFDYPETYISAEIIKSQEMYPPRIKNSGRLTTLGKTLQKFGGGKPYKYVIPAVLGFIGAGTNYFCTNGKILVGWFSPGKTTLELSVDSQKVKVVPGYTVYPLEEFLTPYCIQGPLKSPDGFWGLFAHLPRSQFFNTQEEEEI